MNTLDFTRIESRANWKTRKFGEYAPRVEESTPQDHNGLAGGLFQLHLDAGELLVNDLHHPLDLLRRDRPGAALFPQ